MLVFHLWLIFIHIFSMFVSVCRQPVFLCICVNRGSCRTSPRLWEEVGSLEQIFLLSFLLFCFSSAAWALCITRETHACGEAEGGAERKMLWHDFFQRGLVSSCSRHPGIWNRVFMFRTNNKGLNITLTTVLFSLHVTVSSDQSALAVWALSRDTGRGWRGGVKQTGRRFMKEETL